MGMLGKPYADIEIKGHREDAEEWEGLCNMLTCLWEKWKGDNFIQSWILNS